MQLIGEMLERTAKAYPERPILVFEGLKISYSDFHRKATMLAYGLERIGVSKGDRVMVQLPNCLETVIAHFAVTKLGGIVVPLNVMYVDHEILHIGNDTGASSMVIHSSFMPLLERIKPDLPHLRHVIVVGDRVPQGAWGFHDLTSGPYECHVPRDISFDDVASIIYTSGTTGQPKGATQTHRSILSNVNGCCSRNRFSCEDMLLCALPLFNNFAINVVMMCTVASGATMVLVDRFDARKVLDHVQTHRCTYFAGTPTMFSYLLQEYDPDRDDLSSLRATNSGGAHCPASLVERIEATFGTVHLDGYGQTEACGFSTLNPRVGVRKQDSVGTPLSSIQVRIVSDEGQELPAGQVGEIVERGDVFSTHRYWNRPDVNNVVYRGGWFHSGDLGYLDEDGYLYVVDRKQDLIITGGANIYPAEVESVLYSNPKIAMAAVVGMPDELKGELAKAFIVLKHGESATEREIIDYVRTRIAKYKAPRLVEFVDAMPQGPTGKILKRELRAGFSSSTQ